MLICVYSKFNRKISPWKHGFRSQGLNKGLHNVPLPVSPSGQVPQRNPLGVSSQDTPERIH